MVVAVVVLVEDNRLIQEQQVVEVVEVGVVEFIRIRVIYLQSTYMEYKLDLVV